MENPVAGEHLKAEPVDKNNIGSMSFSVAVAVSYFLELSP